MTEKLSLRLNIFSLIFQEDPSKISELYNTIEFDALHGPKVLTAFSTLQILCLGPARRNPNWDYMVDRETPYCCMRPRLLRRYR